MVTNANTFPAYLALFKVTLRQMFWTPAHCTDSDWLRLIAFYRSHIPVYGGRSGKRQRIHTPDNANPVWTFGEPMRDFLRDRNHLR